VPQFIIIAREAADGGAPCQARSTVRAEHYARIRPLIDRREYLVGGSMKDDHGRIVGSVAIVEFPSREALDAWLVSEPYVTRGVWRHIDIIPFEVSVPASLTPVS